MSTEDIYVERLRACRAAVEAVPAEMIDMHDISGKNGCGCALYHYRRAGGYAWFGPLSRQLKDHLFSVSEDTYPHPTGQPAKNEFLRRIDEVIAEKLAAQAASTPTTP